MWVYSIRPWDYENARESILRTAAVHPRSCGVYALLGALSAVVDHATKCGSTYSDGGRSPRSSANRQEATTRVRLLPFSQSATLCWLIPRHSASSCCDKPRTFRILRIAFPMAANSTAVGLRLTDADDVWPSAFDRSLSRRWSFRSNRAFAPLFPRLPPNSPNCLPTTARWFRRYSTIRRSVNSGGCFPVCCFSRATVFGHHTAFASTWQSGSSFVAFSGVCLRSPSIARSTRGLLVHRRQAAREVSGRMSEQRQKKRGRLTGRANVSGKSPSALSDQAERLFHIVNAGE